MSTEIIDGILSAFAPLAILATALGVMMGIIFGVLPGLTATMGVALLIPLTFDMPPVIAFSALLGVYIGAVYAGSITATLIGTPGTAAAAAALLEGPALTKKGQAKKALTMTTIASSFGGLFSCLALILIAPTLANIALQFGPPEYFALAFFGLSIVASVSGQSLIRGVIAGLIGLFIATIGLDPVNGINRFTFNNPNLLNGVEIVPALIGLFAISEVLKRLEESEVVESKVKSFAEGLKLNELKKNVINLFRSSAIGTFIGIIPAAGSGIAAFVAYNEKKRASKHKEKFGKGNIDGMASTESANSAVTGGALIPLLTFGIPGDVITAVMLGALMIQGLTPGPTLFTDNVSVMYGIFFALILANIFLLIFGLMGTRIFPKILNVPENILMPVIVVLCVVGSFSINNSFFDVLVMFIFGIIGYLMVKMKLPLPPMLLAIILLPLLESNFRRAMVLSGNDITIFLTRPISMIFIIITALVAIGIIIREIRQTREEIKNG
ncbi:tripartite tricarboxylate transporter permease [Salinicoccus sp. YB14-2]|uniref:tripartite tricarboxylate transporter permease n=1 Tax=Salinicoccus sp. YB14-2 TaxID=1572701 RepID=UPI000AC68F34|nr:tripartite tricarboxylate transporter permease [Salinicoccus sp. YB14-2]